MIPRNEDISAITYDIGVYSEVSKKKRRIKNLHILILVVFLFSLISSSIYISAPTSAGSGPIENYTASHTSVQTCDGTTTCTGGAGWYDLPTTTVDIAGSNFSVGEEYLVMVWASWNTASNASNGGVRVRHATTSFTDSEAREETDRNGAAHKTPYFWFTTWTAANEDLEVQMYYNGSNNTLIEDVTLVAMNVEQLTSDGNFYSDEDSGNATMTTSWSVRSTLTFTPNNANDDWWIMGYTRSNTSSTTAGDAFQSQLDIAGSIVATSRVDGEDNNDTPVRPIGWSQQLPASSQTIELEARSLANTQQIDASGVFALNLNAFEDHAVATDEDDSPNPMDVDEEWNDHVSFSLDPTASGDFLFAAGSVMDDNDGRVHSRIRNTTDSTSLTDETGGWQHIADDQWPYSIASFESSLATGSDTYVYQGENSNNQTAESQDSWMIAFSMELPAAPPAAGAPELTQEGYIFENDDYVTPGPSFEGPVTISTGNNFAPGTSIVQTSGGDLYALVRDSVSCEVWKSVNDGTSWTEQDTGSTPSCLQSSRTAGFAIDSSNLIHMVYSESNQDVLSYNTFNTSTDSFGTETSLDTSNDSIFDPQIAIDSNDEPHVTWGISDFTGSDYDEWLYYRNHVGGSWNTIRTVDSNNFTSDYGYFSDITINEDDIPEIAYFDRIQGNVEAAVGNLNNASSFTNHTIDSTVQSTSRTSILVDGDGDTWVAYEDENGANDYVTLAQHQDTDAWTTWQSTVTNSNVGTEPTMTLRNGELIIFYDDESSDIVYDTYDGSTWGGESTLHTGASGNVSVRRAFNNYHNTNEIDYVYDDGTNVVWGRIDYSSVPTGSPPTVNSNVKINDASDFDDQFGVRNLVETYEGTLYTFLHDPGGTDKCEVWKSADNGSTWTEQDSSNSKNCSSGYAAANAGIAAFAAHDDGSDWIHGVWTDGNYIRHDVFDIGNEAWEQEDNIIADFSGDIDVEAGFGSISIAFDSADKLHVIFVETDYNQGDDFDTVRYTNNISASWSTPLTVASNDGFLYDHAGIIVDNDDIPIISIHNNIANVDIYEGNQNNATSFTYERIDSSGYTPSIAVDSAGNVWAAYEDSTNGYISIAEHQYGDAWSTWQTTKHNSNAGTNVSLSIDSNDNKFLLYIDDNDDLVYDVLYEDESWSGEAVIESGTYTNVIARFANYMMHDETVIDFLYEDSTDVWWGSIEAGSPAPASGISAQAGSEFTVGKTLTDVRKGERINLRTHLTNSGGPLSATDELGLFYDNNDGNWRRVLDHSQVLGAPDAADDCESLEGSGASTAWECTTVFDGSNSNDGYASNVAIDNSGQLWGAFWDWTSGSSDVAVTKFVGNGAGNCDTFGGAQGSDDWQCDTVWSGTNSNEDGHGQILEIAPDGTPWLTFQNFETGDSEFIVAEYLGDGSGDCDTVAGGDSGGSDDWDCTVVFNGSNDDDGERGGIAFESDGTPWVVFNRENPSDGRVIVAQYVGGASGDCDTVGDAGGSDDWDCTIVYDGADAQDGEHTAITIDQDDVPHIMFNSSENTGGDALHAVYVGSGGDCQTVGGGAGSSAWDCTRVWEGGENADGDEGDIWIMPNGNPVIAFEDQETDDTSLVIAEYVGGASGDCNTLDEGAGSSDWDCTVVFDGDHTEGATGMALATDPSGTLWVTFRKEVSTTGGQRYIANYVGGGNGNCDTVGGSGGSDDWNCELLFDGTSNIGDATAGVTGNLAIGPTGNIYTAFRDFESSDGRFIVAQLIRGGEITLTQSTHYSNGDSLSESHADMSSYSDGDGQSDSDCLAGSTTWNNGIYFASQTGTGLTIADGATTNQCTEVMWTLDTSQAVAGQTYRFAVALADGSNQAKAKWRGPVAIATDGYPTLTIRGVDETIYRYSKGFTPNWSDCTDTDWVCDQVGDGTDFGDWLDAAFAPDNTLWIALEDDSTASSGDLTVARYVGDGNGTGCFSDSWQCDDILNTDDEGRAAQIAFDSKGTAWVAHKRETNSEVEVAKYVGGGAGSGCDHSDWTCETIDAPNNIGDHLQLVIDHNDTPWLFYRDVNDDDLDYAVFVGGGLGTGCSATSDWDCQSLKDTTSAGLHTSVALSAEGVPWVTWREDVNHDLWVAQFVGAGGNCDNPAWNCEEVAVTGDVGFEGQSIGFKDGSTPVIAFHTNTGNDLLYAEYVGINGDCDSSYAGSDAWDCSTVVSSSNVGLNPKLAIDNEGNPWIKYRDSSNSHLEVARYVGSGGSGCASGVWDGCTNIQAGDYRTTGSELLFDYNGVPWIVGFDQANDDLDVIKMKLPPTAPTSEVIIANTPYNYSNGDLQFRLSSGLSPYTDAYGTCNGNTGFLGYCGLYHPDGQLDGLETDYDDESPIYNFSTRYGNNSMLPSARVQFRTDVSPATSNVVLQVYRFGSTNAWETVQTFNSAGCSSSNCEIRSEPLNTPADYFEADGSNYWVHYRIYQVANSSSSIELQIDSFTGAQTQSQLRHGSVFREQAWDPFRW